MTISVTAHIPVINETYLLSKTIDIIEESMKDDPVSYIISVCNKTTPDSMAVIKRYQEKLQGRLQLHTQKLPFFRRRRQRSVYAG